MPNWTSCELSADGIEKLPIYSKIDGKRSLDFNKIIPMPKTLDMTSGNVTDHAVIYYLTDRCNTPVEQIAKQTHALFNAMLPNCFTKDITFDKWESARKFGEKNEQLYADGEQYVKNYLLYGHATWYSWCNENWGTKWNAVDTYIDSGYVAFDTAWSAPYPVVEALSKQYPDKIFKLTFQNEENYEVVHEIVYKNGVSIRQNSWIDEDAICV